MALGPAANSHPEATHQWLLLGRLKNPLACFILQPTGTPRPHINGFLWASKPAVCQPLNPWHASSCSQQAPQGHTSMASYGRPSLPFASPSTLKTLQTLQTLKNLKTLQTLTWHEQAPQGHTSVASYGPLKQSLGMLHPAANSHPEATHQWLLLGRLNNPLACFILQPTGTPRPHINGFLWASKPAVCQPFNP